MANETPDNSLNIEIAHAALGRNTSQSDTARETSEDAREPFPDPLMEPGDRVALRDELTEAQRNPTRAARLSGDHFSRLLYGPDVTAHISPYGVPPVPNSLDSRGK